MTALSWMGVGLFAALVYGSFFEWIFHVMHRFGKRFWLPWPALWLRD